MFTNVSIQQQDSRSNAGAITQTKQAKQLPAVPVVALQTQVLQMVLDDKNVVAKAKDFLQCHDDEKKLIQTANNLLEEYNKKNSKENFDKLNDNLPGLRDEINKKTDTMAGIIGDYALCKEKEVRKTFIDTVLEKDTEMAPLFDKLIDQTVLDKDVDEKFKNRFLSYTLQSLKFKTGEGRVKELMGLLGDRKIMINALNYGGPKAGQADPVKDNPKSEKTNARDKVADEKLLKKVGGNLAEFINEKRKLEDNRTVNPQKNEIGNLQIFMDKSDKLLPIYYGLKDENVKAYTSPAFTAVHHELGHLTNALKGKHGRKTDKYVGTEGVLASLTDEEELQNISLDKYSDKAFTDEIGLPERIAHTSMGGLDSGSPDSVSKDNESLFSEIQRWDERTYGKKKKIYHELLTQIKTIADKYWGKHTNWKFKPKGVTKVAEEVEQIATGSEASTNQLIRVKNIAVKAKDGDGSGRTKATTEFYDTLAAISIDSEEQMNATIIALKKILSTYFAD